MININGEEWRIALVSPFDPILVRQDLDGFTLGTCDDLAKTIYINKDLDEDYMWKVLSHELTHAAMFSYNVILPLELEEILADIIATHGQEIIYITNLVFDRIKNKRGRL